MYIKIQPTAALWRLGHTVTDSLMGILVGSMPASMGVSIGNRLYGQQFTVNRQQLHSPYLSN